MGGSVGGGGGGVGMRGYVQGEWRRIVGWEEGVDAVGAGIK
jgi:hypothetical protein